MRFDGRTAVVTGAGSGIGAEMVRLLLEEGATVFAGDLDPDGVPVGATAIRTDVSSETDMQALVAAANDRTGRLDAMFNNAGIGSTTALVDATVEEWDRVFSVNGRGTFLGCREAARVMVPQGHGVITNTASVAGMVGLRNRTSYSASKAAVVGLTKNVAVEYAGILRCNCICPGTVDSPWVGRLLADAGDDPEAARAALIARQPMGRLGTPTEIAKAALYLASDDAAFVTGTAFVIDGGLTAQ